MQHSRSTVQRRQALFDAFAREAIRLRGQLAAGAHVLELG
jgi:hypothetical protein